MCVYMLRYVFKSCTNFKFLKFYANDNFVMIYSKIIYGLYYLYLCSPVKQAAD